MNDLASRRLSNVSNRLPIVLRRASETPGGWRVERGADGLVSALNPVPKAHGGERIG